MKKRLHPHLVGNSCGPHKKDSGNSYFYGGRLNFFGISMDISWDQHENTWNLSNTDVVDNAEIIAALSDFSSAIGQDYIDLVFGDEKEVFFNDLRTDSSYGVEDKIFYDKTGRRWMVGRDCLDGPAESKICFELKALGVSPTGVVKEFESSQLVYVYPSEIGR